MALKVEPSAPQAEGGEPGHGFKDVVQGEVNLGFLALANLIDCGDERWMIESGHRKRNNGDTLVAQRFS